MFQTLLTIAAMISTVFTIILLSLPSQYKGKTRNAGSGGPEDESKSRVDVQILVLGDIGRSPRMQYHATSIVKQGGYVQLIGYCDSAPNPDVSSNSRISIIPLRSPPSSWQTSNKLLFLFFAPLKVLFQIWTLWIALGYRTKPSKWMLVQNPPSIPTLAIAQFICYLRHTRLIIDWHNFGYSILALKLGPSHPLVRASKYYERKFSQRATAHFCVTNAMSLILKNDFHLTAPILPLHDRPASHFLPIPPQKRASKLSSILLSLSTAHKPLNLTPGTRLLISPTSWTPDEDFSLLLHALTLYSTLATTTHPHLPELLAIITGKGPLKADYLAQIHQLEASGRLEMTHLLTAWLSITDYAALLACADLGISLHTSSSGVDLPMKVVDMFGAGLPVLGWDRFEAWAELVKEGINGMGFGSAEGLVECLVGLFGGGEDAGAGLERLREGAGRESRWRWEDEWDGVAGKVLGLI